MLPKPNRLSTSSQIVQVRTTGEKFISRYALFLVVRTNDGVPPRFAFIVSKKVSKLATKRNRTKRLLREAVHSLLPQIQNGISGVCIAKYDLSEVPLQEVIGDMAKLFNTANIITRHSERSEAE